MILSKEDQPLLLSALPGMAYRCSIRPPWKLEYVSPGVRDFCSIEPSAFLSGEVDWASIVHPEDLENVSREVAEAVAQGRAFTMTYRICDPVLGQRWVLENGRAATGRSGKPVALVGFISDITAQKHAEESLRASEDHYRATVDLNPQIPWTADPSGEILEAGLRWLKIGVPDQSTTLAHKWFDVVHASDRERVLQAWKSSLVKGTEFDVRYRLPARDGSYRWVRARASPRRDAQGSIFKWYGTLDDISQQVDLEEQLRGAEQRYALAARATGDIIWDWNLDTGTVVRVGTENSRLGYSPDTLSTASSDWWMALVHPDDQERVRDGVAELLSSDRNRWSDEYRVRRSDGSYAYVIDKGHLVPADVGTARRMVGAIQDLSESKHAQDAVRQLESQLIQLSQRTAVAAVAATVAHELNQPLSAIANWIALGQHHIETMSVPGARKVGEALGKANAQVVRAGEIIHRMRGVISEGSVRREQTSLRMLIKNVRTLLRAGSPDTQFRLAVEVPDSADQIHVDPIQIEELLLNLLQNACQAAGEGDLPKVKISATEDGHAVTVRVRDNGRGIAKGEEAALFNRFGESTTGGLGVGLSIARTMIQAHGGKIWASNNNTGGASIWFTIPRATD